MIYSSRAAASATFASGTTATGTAGTVLLETVHKDGNVAGETNVSMSIESSDTNGNDSSSQNKVDSLCFSPDRGRVDSFHRTANSSINNGHSPGNEEKKEVNIQSIATALHHNDTADFLPASSRQLKCCGCFRPNEHRHGSKNEFTGTTYSDPNKYGDSSDGVNYDETTTAEPSHHLR